MKTLLLTLLFTYTLFGAPAINRELTFTQPDGTTFKGYLKGDSALHWVESEEEVLIYNPKDKFYYKAIIDEQKGKLAPSSEKFYPSALQNVGVNGSSKRKISEKTKEALKNLYKKMKTQNLPR